MIAPNLRPFYQEGLVEAGCDEAGRGPLAGPVYAAAVILPADFHHPLLDDSKKMSASARERLRPVIESVATSWAVESVSPEEIDALNILWASVAGMQRAIGRLALVPDLILVDGNRFKPYRGIPYKTIVHGDATYASIAAASVLAKTYRDEFMVKLSAEYPEYGWDHNFGYPTKEHLAAIKKYGYTLWHRRSFHPKELEQGLFDYMEKG